MPCLWDCPPNENALPLQSIIHQSKRTMAQIKVNGEWQTVELPLNISQLIAANDVEQPEMVSVQVNEEFADREEWDNIAIKDGDEVDFLYFMGGGAHD